MIKGFALVMVFFVCISASASAFGLHVAPSFGKTFESLGSVINVLHDNVIAKLVGVVKDTSTLISGDYYSNIYVRDIENFGEELGGTLDWTYNDELLGVHYCVKFDYFSGEFGNAYTGYTEWQTFVNDYDPQAVFICFDSNGEFVRLLLVCESNVVTTTDFAMGSYYSEHHNRCYIFFEDHKENSSVPLTAEFTIYIEDQMGNLHNFVDAYLK